MLIGNKINLRIMEKEDMPIVKDWVNNSEFVGDYEPITQETLIEIEKQYENLTEGQWFFIEKKRYFGHLIGSRLYCKGYQRFS